MSFLHNLHFPEVAFANNSISNVSRKTGNLTKSLRECVVQGTTFCRFDKHCSHLMSLNINSLSGGPGFFRRFLNVCKKLFSRVLLAN